MTVSVKNSLILGEYKAAFHRDHHIMMATGQVKLHFYSKYLLWNKLFLVIDVYDSYRTVISE